MKISFWISKQWALTNAYWHRISHLFTSIYIHLTVIRCMGDWTINKCMKYTTDVYSSIVYSKYFLLILGKYTLTFTCIHMKDYIFDIKIYSTSTLLSNKILILRHDNSYMNDFIRIRKQKYPISETWIMIAQSHRHIYRKRSHT